ncbi:hypothetical protein [Thermofilum pendens]|uniref:Uncharacterized protein n=1 Tax=Thermofilum pendens (strain DSM 2475 / Hrk 5) TaxID=368408 RepID=A1RXC9_THEPD|nr:hypothetical protein [Thermofilum pendens]ABL77859.1 hypothetical protein Tpen_0450 [Thermofilum pendens Hrk 5]
MGRGIELEVDEKTREIVERVARERVEKASSRLDERYLEVYEYLARVARKLRERWPWLSILTIYMLILLDKAYEQAKQRLNEFLSAEWHVFRSGKKTWRIYPKDKGFYVMIGKAPKGNFNVVLPLDNVATDVFIKGLKLTARVRWYALRGWLLSDIHYSRKRRLLDAGTDQSWQVIAISALLNDVVARIAVRSLILGKNSLNFAWRILTNILLPWELKGKAKEITTEKFVLRIKKKDVNKLKPSEALTLLTLYLGDGAIPNFKVNMLHILANNRDLPITGAKAIQLAQKMLEVSGEYGELLKLLQVRKYQYLEILSNRKANNVVRMHIVVAGVKMHLILVGGASHFGLEARVLETRKTKIPENFAELAEREGLKVEETTIRYKGWNGRVYEYRAWHAYTEELLEFAHLRPQAYCVYLKYLYAKREKYENRCTIEKVQRLIDRIIRDARKHAPKTLEACLEELGQES